MPETSPRKVEVRLWIALAACFALLAACLPLAVMLDEHQDRKRPMYLDLAMVKWLEYEHITLTGQPLTLHLDHRQTATVGGHHFRPAAGDTVEVTVDGEGYCARVHNRDGDSTGWHCDDGQHDPGQPPSLDD